MPLVDQVETDGMFGSFDLPEEEVEEEPTDPEDEPQDLEEELPEDDLQEDPEEVEENPEEEPEDDPEEEESGEEDPEGEEDTDEPEEEATPVVEEIQTQTGLDLDGEYEDSIDGISKMIVDAGEEMANQQIEQIMEQYPDVGQYLQYRAQGGDPEEFQETFFNNEGWQNVEVREDDQSQQETIVRSRLREEGYEEDEIEDTVADYKTAGILESEARRSIKRLQKIEQDQQEKLLAEQEERAKAAKKEKQEFLDDVTNTIQENKEFNGIGIPETEKGDFIEYLTQPVDEQGNTQYALDTMQAEMNDQIAMALMSYYGFDLSDLIERKASSESAKSLRDRLSKANGKKTPTDKSKTTEKSKSDDINLDALKTNVGDLA